MEKVSLSDKILKWVGVLGAIGALGIGGFILEARHSIQNSEIKELIRAENELHTTVITETVIQVLRKDLRDFRDSINTDHNRLMNANYQKDSLLLIVIPRMLQQTKEATTAVKRIEAKLQTTETNDTQPIWEYLIEKEKRDSITDRDAAIMRELRSINRQLLNSPKYGDKIK